MHIYTRICKCTNIIMCICVYVSTAGRVCEREMRGGEVGEGRDVEKSDVEKRERERERER
jgi:hypothetical protein